MLATFLERMITDPPSVTTPSNNVAATKSTSPCHTAKSLSTAPSSQGHVVSQRAKQLLAVNAVFAQLGPLLKREYIVADCLLTLLGRLTDYTHLSAPQQHVSALLDFMWCAMEEHELKPCLEHLLTALQNAYRFTPTQLGFVDEVRVRGVLAGTVSLLRATVELCVVIH